ncbi:MAG TPA: hypothetical protein VK639_03505 [Terriglobales bacterium]|nr:hypothetical protein [Terriglobales bacterium]
MTNLQERDDAHLYVLLACVIGSSISLVQASTWPIVNVWPPIALTATASVASAGIATPAPISATPTPSATPPVDPARSEIEAGDTFLAEHEFSDANQAYLRALKSADATTRKQALEGIKRSLSSKDFRSSMVFYWNHPSRLVEIFKTPIKIVFGIAAIWLFWWFTAKVGNVILRKLADETPANISGFQWICSDFRSEIDL